MRRVLPVLGAMSVAGLAMSVSVAASPATSASVIPGKGIGKLELGMTLTQVNHRLGKPTLMLKRLALPAGKWYLEYQWEVEGNRGPSTWTVGLRGTQRASALRVVRVATTVPTQRTRQGIGIGSRPRSVVAAYPSATCIVRDYNGPWRGEWLVVDAAGGGMAAFQIYQRRDYGPRKPYAVIEVLVQRNWFSPTPSRSDCAPEWRQR